MPLEKDLQDATAAMNRLSDNMEKYGPAIAAMGGGATAAETSEKKPVGRPKKDEAKASKYTPEQITELATKLKEEKGKEAAQALIKQIGGGNLAELKTKPEKFDEFAAAVEAALNAEDDDGL